MAAIAFGIGGLICVAPMARIFGYFDGPYMLLDFSSSYPKTWKLCDFKLWRLTGSTGGFVTHSSKLLDTVPFSLKYQAGCIWL